MTKLDKDQVLQGFSQAYENVHGKTPDIQAKGGWYSVEGGKNMRLAQLAEEIEVLNNQTKPAAVVSEKSTPKAKPKKSAKKSSAAFSVKQFWSEQLTQRDPSAVMPR